MHYGILNLLFILSLSPLNIDFFGNFIFHPADINKFVIIRLVWSWLIERLLTEWWRAWVNTWRTSRWATGWSRSFWHTVRTAWTASRRRATSAPSSRSGSPACPETGPTGSRMPKARRLWISSPSRASPSTRWSTLLTSPRWIRGYRRRRPACLAAVCLLVSVTVASE